MMGPEQAPTRAAVLELKAERVVVQEAYDFLDEKRMLLAAEILAQLKRYEPLRDEFEQRNRHARQQMSAALKRHGLQGLSVYPAASLDRARLETETGNLMGVTLLDTQLLLPELETTPPIPASNPSAEAEQCRATFRELAELGAILAGITGNLYRLQAEYRLTERRARALENVILPDIQQALRRMTGYLEEIDLEDAIRARPMGPGQA